MKKDISRLWQLVFAVTLLLPAYIVRAADVSEYRLFDNFTCPGNDALVCWLGEVWKFSQVAILVLAVAAIVMAGIIYMTSAGNPKQIAMAKKVIVGALTGVAVMVMGKFFLVNIIGVEWIW